MTGMPNPDNDKQEIIIVRRGGGDDHDEHHGGVWKIAFADFMTAMMCFFLVMWLINAANEQTRMSVASYFNPVKLIDRNTNKKGLDDIGEGPESANVVEDSEEKTTDKPVGERRSLTGPAQHKNSNNLSETQKFSDANLFSDPYAILAEIAQETAMLQNTSDKGDGGAQIAGPATGADGGEAYRDPFAPDFWSQQVAEPKQGVTGDPDEARDNPSGIDAKGEHETPPASEAEIQAEAEAMLSGQAPEREQQVVVDPFRMARVEELKPLEEPRAEEPETPSEATERLADDIRGELERAFGDDAGFRSGITVMPARTGVMISVMDEMKNAMFGIGSAVPHGELVLAMEKIGATLAEHKGAVTINGHTDGRPFAGGEYDNWRLSTARAHSAYYMLVRAGLEETRIESVAGFADRKLKVPSDPFADANRRIEILLETGG